MRRYFKKADRLLKRSEYLKLAQHGRRTENRFFIAVFHPDQNGHTRLGITVTKRVGNAVTRNRIKRQVREYFRLNRDQIRGCWRINIIAKVSSAAGESTEIRAALKNLTDRISRHAENR